MMVYEIKYDNKDYPKMNELLSLVELGNFPMVLVKGEMFIKPTVVTFWFTTVC